MVPGVSAAPNDHFGYSVAISGDTIAVGAVVDDTPLTKAGAVYVFAKNSVGSYVQQPKIFLVSGHNGDHLVVVHWAHLSN